MSSRALLASSGVVVRDLVTVNLRSWGSFLHELARADEQGTPLRTRALCGGCVPWAAGFPWISAAVHTDVGCLPGRIAAGLVWSTLDLPLAERSDDRMVLMAAALSATAASRDEHVTTAIDLTALGQINDEAYGTAAIARVLAGPLRNCRGYGIHDAAGELVCGLLVFEHGADASVQWVATRPDHRRRGFARRTFAHALADQRARGRRTVSLQATAEALELYRAAGLTVVGAVRCYEAPLGSSPP